MEYIGYTMIAVLFIGLFAHIAHSSGFKVLVGVFTAWAGITGFISLACYFIGGGTI